MELVMVSYALAKRLPQIEVYGLASQIRRAAISVPANIAEGHGREHRGEYLHHVAPMLSMTAELGRMLAGLLKSLRKKPLVPDP